MGSDTRAMLERFQRHPEAFARSETLEQFAANIGGGEGENLARYVGGWADYSFRTAKTHGLDKAPARPLYCPEARTLADLVEDVRFIPTPPGGMYRDEARAYVDGRFFVYSSHRQGRAGEDGGESLPRYSVGAEYGYSSTRDGAGNPIRRQSGGVDHATYARPTKALADAWAAIVDSTPGTISALELIRWADGRTLAVASHINGIFDLWAAVLDPGAADGLALMPEADRALVEAERAKMRDAWGEAR